MRCQDVRPDIAGDPRADDIAVAFAPGLQQWLDVIGVIGAVGDQKRAVCFQPLVALVSRVFYQREEFERFEFFEHLRAQFVG